MAPQTKEALAADLEEACEALLLRVLEKGTMDNQTVCAALLGPARAQSV